MFFKLLNNYKKKQLMKKISNYTFGIYIIHPLILNVIRKIIGDFGQIKILLSIPLLTIIVFILSLNNNLYYYKNNIFFWKIFNLNNEHILILAVQFIRLIYLIYLSTPIPKFFPIYMEGWFDNLF